MQSISFVKKNSITGFLVSFPFKGVEVHGSRDAWSLLAFCHSEWLPEPTFTGRLHIRMACEFRPRVPTVGDARLNAKSIVKKLQQYGCFPNTSRYTRASMYIYINLGLVRLTDFKSFVSLVRCEWVCKNALRSRPDGSTIIMR